MEHFVCFALLLLFQFYLSEAIKDDVEQYPVIETKNGLIQGSRIVSTKGREFYSFRGIPFAKPPVGELRFKPPLPYGKWNGTLDATNIRPFCIQIFVFGIEGQEDCLWLNIHTPKIKSANLPVVLYLFPGGFVLGDGNYPISTSPWSIMDHDIVFVTANARLGVLGFLSTGDAVSPGNYHLLDNILALKWIKENIQDYGGNPNRITLWGVSSGAAVAMHLLSSPLTKGMIQGVIAESSNSIMPSILSEGVSSTYLLAQSLGCWFNSSQEIVDCLRHKTAKEIQIVGLTKLGKKMYKFIGSYLPPTFLPIVDDAAGSQATIPKHPLTILQEGRFHHGVPVLTGISRDEASLYVMPYISEHPDCMSQFKQKYFHTLTELFGIKVTNKLKKDLFHYYFKDTDFTNETDFKIKVINWMSDGIYKASHDLAVRLLARYNPVYSYSFEYENNKKPGDPYIGHSLLMYYILNPFLVPQRMQTTIEKITTYWINFIKFGNPTPDGLEPKWETMKPNSSKLHYFRIAQNISMQSGYREKELRFWQKRLFNFTLIEGDDTEDESSTSIEFLN